jgi:hypothetical protein
MGALPSAADALNVVTNISAAQGKLRAPSAGCADPCTPLRKLDVTICVASHERRFVLRIAVWNDTFRVSGDWAAIP